MKAQLHLLLLLPLFLSGCEKYDTAQSRNFDITEYMIVGKAIDGHKVDASLPYIITFDASGRAIVYTVDDRQEADYKVSGSRITLAGLGYIEIENRQVTKMSLSNIQLTNGVLIKPSKASENDAYPDGYYMIWNANGYAVNNSWIRDYKITVAGNSITESWMQHNGSRTKKWAAITRNYNHTREGRSGSGAAYADPKLILYMNPDDGTQQCWLEASGQYHYYQY